ncbi:sensor histidine kinase [Litoribaculum gwangyangense]
MDQDLTSYFFNYSFSNGFIYFTIGILFILSVFHFLLYFQHKDKVYLYYSCYSFFIIFSQLHHLQEGFLYQLFSYCPWMINYPMVATEIYFVFYALFAFQFLNLKTELPKWHRYNIYTLIAIISFCLIVLVVYAISQDYSILLKGYFIFTIPMIVYALVMYIPFFKIKSPLKYYIIVGSFILMLSSIISLLKYLNLQSKGLSIEPSYSILYIGFILENVLFALGLGHKQKLILNDRNTSKNKLIEQLKENSTLKQKIQEQLEIEVDRLNKQAEIDRLKNKQTLYDKQFAELKVSALRSQMNPHFIFNALNSIKRYIIDNEKENAVFYLNKFSKLVRKILASSMEKESTLAEEIETIKLYVNIENIRFNNTIGFDLVIDETLNVSTIKLPSLITQPFIENAIWHGLSLKNDNRKLTLSVQKKGSSQVRIDILDNGIGRERSTRIKQKKLLKKRSVGIKLSKERLKHFSDNYKSKSKIVITDLYEQDKPAGTKVSILIPLQ